MKVKKLTLPLYEQPFYLFIKGQEGPVPRNLSYLSQVIDRELDGETQGLSMDEVDNNPFVIAVTDDDGIKIGTLFHEIAHLSLFICGKFGIEVREGRKNEAYCYIVSPIYSLIEKEVLK